MAQAKERQRPLTFQIAKWYSMIFSAVFVLYGVVKIVLGFLDRNYNSFGMALGFCILGLALIALCLAYNELKKWGWYGLIAMNGLVVIVCLAQLSQYSSIVLLLFSGATLGFLLARPTRDLIEGRI